jgi:hypothetical protein
VRARPYDGPGCRRGPGSRRRAQAVDAARQRAGMHPDRDGRGAGGLLAHRSRRPEARRGGEAAGSQARVGGSASGHRNAVVADSRAARGLGQSRNDAGSRPYVAGRRRAGRRARQHRAARPECARVVDAHGGLSSGGPNRSQAAAALAARSTARRAGRALDAVSYCHRARCTAEPYPNGAARGRDISDPDGAGASGATEAGSSLSHSGGRPAACRHRPVRIRKRSTDCHTGEYR